MGVANCIYVNLIRFSCIPPECTIDLANVASVLRRTFARRVDGKEAKKNGANLSHAKNCFRAYPENRGIYGLDHLAPSEFSEPDQT